MKKRINLFLLVMLQLAGCADAPGPAPQSGPEDPGARSNDPQVVLGRTWQWLGTQTPLEAVTVVEPGRYTVRFGKDGAAAIRFDCNSGGGDFQLSAGSIEFGNLFATRMACPPDSQDAIFMRQLEAARIFFVQGGVLYLDLFADGGTMRFEPAPEASGQPPQR